MTKEELKAVVERMANQFARGIITREECYMKTYELVLEFLYEEV